MGLDMYLRAKRYYWKSNDQDVETSKKIAEAMGTPELNVREVSVLVGQWRKSNQIHNWFVENVQEGEDDCRPYAVGTDELDELRELCVRLLESKDEKMAEELLPCTQGFFFGSQNYDGYYWGDLMETIEIIDKCKTLGKDWDFEYQASW
jgi:hypothetical protein